MLGDRPWKIRYVVTVRFTSSGLTPRLSAMEGIAGKYMFDEIAEKVAAIATVVTIMAFWNLVKMLWGSAGRDSAESPNSSPDLSSIFVPYRNP